MENDLKQKCLEAIAKNPNLLFPNLNFDDRRNKAIWHSPFKIDGSKPRQARQDKTFIYKNNPGFIHENGESPKGIDIFNLIQTNNGLKDFVSALHYICKVYGIPFDEKNAQLLKQKQLKDNILNKYADIFKENLKKENASIVFEYLKSDKSKHGRNYTDETISLMSEYIGFITKENITEFNKECKEKNIDCYINTNVSSDFPLVIIYYSMGAIRGFKFRKVKKDDNGIFATDGIKYIGLKSFKINDWLYNLDPNSRKKITIVEGEFDALHAKIKGMENVIAVNGGGEWFSDEQIITLKNAGVEQVTLLTDFEANEESQKTTDRKNLNALEKLNKSGISGFLASFLVETEKVDLDSYLNLHSANEANEIIDSAISYASLCADNILNEFNLSSLNERNIIELISKLQTKYKEFKNIADMELFYSFIEKRISRDNVKFWELFDGWQRIVKEKVCKEKQINDLQSIIKTELSQAIDSNNIISVKNLFQKGLNYCNLDRYVNFNSLIAPVTEYAIIKRLQEMPATIKTDYYFKRRNETETVRLEIPCGALTIIGACTGHGKSTFLQNLAINILSKREKDETLLYFSFEESYEDTLVEFISKYAGLKLSSHNRGTILDYFINDSLEFFEGREKNMNLNSFIAKKNELIQKIVNREISIFTETEDNINLKDVDLFCEVIDFICAKRKIKAVFIDYLQEFTCKSADKYEMYKYVCTLLRQCAIRNKIAIICASQMNRTVSKPTDLVAQKLSDASDFEKVANMVILLWNTSFEADGCENWERENNVTLGETTHPHIYAKIEKNRHNKKGLTAIFEADLNIGKIYTGNEKPGTPKYTVGKLFNNNNNEDETNEVPF